MIPNRSRRPRVVIALMLMWLCGAPVLAANPREQQICDATADHYLVSEDYAEAVRLHREYLQKHPQTRSRTIIWALRMDTGDQRV
jgi:hypothetical protein